MCRGRLKAVPGAMVSPWVWLVEGIDDGSDRMRSIYKRTREGEAYDGWRIDVVEVDGLLSLGAERDGRREARLVAGER